MLAHSLSSLLEEKLIGCVPSTQLTAAMQLFQDRLSKRTLTSAGLISFLSSAGSTFMRRLFANLPFLYGVGYCDQYSIKQRGVNFVDYSENSPNSENLEEICSKLSLNATFIASCAASRPVWRMVMVCFWVLFS